LPYFVLEFFPFFGSLFDFESEKGLHTLREHLYLLDRFSIHFLLAPVRARIKVDLVVDEAKLAQCQFIPEANLEMRRELFYNLRFLQELPIETLLAIRFVD